MSPKPGAQQQESSRLFTIGERASPVRIMREWICLNSFMVLQASNRGFNANCVEVREVGGGGARGRGEDILEISLWMFEGVKWKAEVKRETWLSWKGEDMG